VVYVDDFSGQSAEAWAQRTVRVSDLRGYDSLLAVSTTGRAYAFLVPSAVHNVSESQVNNLRRNQIEPALRAGDWSGAAVAAAKGLDTTPRSSGRIIVLMELDVIVIAVVILLLDIRYVSSLRVSDMLHAE
jgi:hypothetical protein